MACEKCRARKIKCDRSRPRCKNCVLHSVPCFYVGERQKRRKLSGPEIEDRLHRMERLFQSMQNGLITDLDPDSANAVFSTVHSGIENWPAYHQVIDDGLGSTQQGSPPRAPSASLEERVFGSQAHTAEVSSAGAIVPSLRSVSTTQEADDGGPVRPHSAPDDLLDEILSGRDSRPPRDRNAAVWMRTADGDEYTGPSSGISLLSDVGLAWLRDNVGGSETLWAILKDLRNSVLNHLRVPKCMPSDPWRRTGHDKVQKSLPPVDVMRAYVHAYFDFVQCIFPVLDREIFEAQFDTFVSDPTQFDPSWYALLNAVLASGCRAVLSAETAEAFQHSGHEAWGFFQNALDYEVELIHRSTNLTAVQAFTVMAIYAQGMSSPQRLEYTLSSIAARLAQSLALHRQPRREWNLSSGEMRERNRLFWSIYCLDRTIALRCGRPAVISDEEISCSFPRGVRVRQPSRLKAGRSSTADGQQPPFDFFLSLTCFARLCGKISKMLYSANGLSQPCSKLLVRAKEVSNDLEKWREAIPPEIRPGQAFLPSRLPEDLPLIQALVLHFDYNYAVCAIHRRFTSLFAPSSGSGDSAGGENMSSLKPLDLNTAVTPLEAARSMILLTKYLDIESYTPGW